MSPQQIPPRLDLPCIAFHDYDHRSTVLFSLSEHKRIANGDADEVLRNKIICPTAQGLLLVRDPDTMATFLWSPSSTDTKIQLPPLEDVDDAVLMDKPLPPLRQAGQPKLRRDLGRGLGRHLIWYCHPGDDHWERYEYDIGSHILTYPWDDEKEDQIQKGIICSVAACGGKFYFDKRATEMYVLDFSGPAPPTLTAVAVAVDGTVTADGTYKRHPGRLFLVESGGDLYMVHLLFASPDVGGEIDRCSVHRMDFSSMRWRNVRGLGGRAFLLSRFYFGASCSADAEHGLLPDRVYFVFDRNNTLQVFDVRDGNYQLQMKLLKWIKRSGCSRL